MNSSILTAIESLCDDIATNTNPEENKKRAEAVVSLAFVGIFTPAEYDDEYEDKTSEGKAAPVADVSKVPQAGEQFEYNGVKFTALGEEQGGVLAIVSELLEEVMPLDKSNKNDWRISSLRKYLNGEYLEQFNRGDLLPFVSDLTSDDGMKNYGTAEDYVFLLSCDLYRKYRESVPRFNNWWWTLTSWTCAPASESIAQVVNSAGGVNENYAYIGYGVAPACLFNHKIFE